MEVGDTVTFRSLASAVYLNGSREMVVETGKRVGVGPSFTSKPVSAPEANLMRADPALCNVGHAWPTRVAEVAAGRRR